MKDLEFSAQVGVFRLADHRLVRLCGREGNLAQLRSGEYFSFVLRIRNNGRKDYVWKTACVQVDGGDAWHWAGASVKAGSEGMCHIFPQNMKKCAVPGDHTAVWHLDGRAVHQERFSFFREDVFPMPTRQEIAQYRNPRSLRSPYIAGWLHIPPEIRFTEYQIDFRAGHLPEGTYCCLGSWSMDLSGLRKRFPAVRSDSIHGYAGFQKLPGGQTASILSFWDIFCTDRTGREQTLSAEPLYPRTAMGGTRFWGEGTGTRCLLPFQWEAGRWYRMGLRCFPSPETGTTLVEQWVCDPDTGDKRLLCCCDTGLPDSAFVGNVAVFLENFTPATAGEVRSMELRGAMYRREDTKGWCGVPSVYLHSQAGLPHYEGSYHFGVRENRIQMITSGVGGDWFHNGKGRQGATFPLDRFTE